METSILLTFLAISLCLALTLLFLQQKKKTKKGARLLLPPGPPPIPILGNLLMLRKSFSQLEPVLHRLRSRYGPIVTLYIGPRPAIFIMDHGLAHKALIQQGAAFADRPPARGANQIFTSNQHNVNAAPYGPLWRLLRRNLKSEILHPSRVRVYAQGRKWVLGILIKELRNLAGSSDGVVVPMESFKFSMFCLLVLMCFGEKLEEKAIREIEDVQRNLLLLVVRLNIFNMLPRIGMLLFPKRWDKFLEIRRRQEDVLIPLIRARRDVNKNSRHQQSEHSFLISYVDTLLELELPDEGGRSLTEGELVSICSEFLNAGTDTTSTALQWIMANLVKCQDIQNKLVEEIEGVVGNGEDITEEGLQKMPYLKAVIMEGLRRHPPAHFVLPHTVTEDVSLEGYLIPKTAVINFVVAEIGCDGKLWEDPMEFKPERFLAGGEGEGVDITGSREIRMMPFGVGRRICPGLDLAILHLEYFVANLVREFEWKGVEGEEIDLSEKPEFTTVMKNPLRAHVSPRGRK